MRTNGDQRFLDHFEDRFNRKWRISRRPVTKVENKSEPLNLFAFTIACIVPPAQVTNGIGPNGNYLNGEQRQIELRRVVTVQKNPETSGNPDAIKPEPKPTVEAQPPPESKTEQLHDKTEQKEEPSMQQNQDQDTVKDQPPPNPGDTDTEVDARTRANRANSQKSTGAKTPEGRAASSKNAIKHALFA
ncbi:MAG: hypothetical protein WBW33_34390, partial [Bryobacteraceae bacterium]